MKSIRYKQLSGELIILLLIFLVSFWAISNFMDLNSALDRILVENYRSVLAAENMIGSIERQDSAALYYLLGSRDEGQKLFDKYHGEFMIWFGKEKDNITVPGEEELVSNIYLNYTSYLSEFDTIKSIYGSEGSNAAIKYYFDRVLPQVMSVRLLCKDLLEMNHKTITERNEIAENVANNAIWSTIAVSILAIAFGFCWNIYISGIVVGPILKLTDKVKSISEGNLGETIDIKTDDEIGILASEFNDMTKHLKEYQNINIDKLISERKKSETIVREIYDGIIVVDKDSKIALVNKAAEIILNKDENAIRGKHFLEVIKDDSIYMVLKAALERRSEDEDETDVTMISRILGGVKKHYTVRATPIEGKEKTIEGAVILLGDVTHFKEIDEMKSDFVSVVSHEFRTPLTSIQMGVGLLLESKLVKDGTREKELLDVIDEDSKRLNRLVSELLDLTRIESGKIDMEFRRIDAVRIIVDAVQSFELQAEEKGIELKKEIKTKEPINIYADNDKVTWVLVNLISNAMRYTPQGGNITVSIEQNGNKAYIAVKDTGIGIHPKYHEKIFDKFTQVKNDGVTAGGAGLGLAISKDIVKAHKGRIWVESEESKGSTFIFTLPLME
jgi:PAS domain S-box-containing protein